MGIEDNILNKFDRGITENCCKVISISLYFHNCEIDNIEKYLFSIYRTVKNVKKNLEDRVVRLYFDVSVYQCILNLDIQHQKIIEIFEDITNSPNIEIYTYVCENKSISLEKTRTHCFLPLSDPKVALCVVREADGFVSNLECHNIKLYDKSNKLFYLPQIMDTTYLFSSDKFKRYDSYQAWLRYYKDMLECEYFYGHQNIYDLLAGLFSIKLRFNRENYLEHMHTLRNRLNQLVVDFKHIQDKKDITNTCHTFSDHNARIYDMDDVNNVNVANVEMLLDVGFDEILLLDFLKEIISVKIPIPSDAKNIEYKIELNIKRKLFFQHNMHIFHLHTVNNYVDLYYNLIKHGIITHISEDIKQKIINITNNNIVHGLFVIDALLSNITFDYLFDIKYMYTHSNGMNELYSVSSLLNKLYKLMYDPLYSSAN